MLRFFVLIYGLSVIEAYSIKVSGQVELGNELSNLFKEVYSQLAENGMNPAALIRDNGDMANLVSSLKLQRDPEATQSREADGNNESKIKKHKELNERDVPILDKMIKNDQEKLHLYGHHKYKDAKPGEPINNVHL